jgi:hypothetical protein
MPGLRRRLVLILALAFAASTVFHVLGGEHAAPAGAHSHESTAMAHHAGGEPGCPSETGEPHGTECALTGGCTFCVPVGGSAAFALLQAAPAGMQPQAARLGNVPSPYFRPPKFLLNV